ncbi:MAG TPA: hypothetical protein VH373_15825 [Jatrophihabitantaceae bacterium]|jgi:hypothetical protein
MSERPQETTRRPGGRALDIAGIVAVALSGVLAAVIAVFLTPLYWGTFLSPLAIVVAIAANIVLPLLARSLGMSPIGSALPYVLWLLTVIVLGTSRPEGDVLLPAGNGAQPLVTYGMLAGGALAGGLTVAIMTLGRATARPPVDGSATDRPAAQPAAQPAERPAPPARPAEKRPARPSGRPRGRR